MKAYVLAFLLGLTASVSSAWTPEEMNVEIEQTNFIVGNHCSATLVDVEQRILLTNHHCIQQFVTKEKRNVTDEDGIIHEKWFEVLKPVPVSQKSYADFELVSEASYIGDIVAFEEDVDLALVQLKVNKLPHTKEANIFMGDQLYRGETVYAVGNPRMLDLSVSKGVISALNRKIMVSGKEFRYYQIDARIAGGSSGGALYNEEGSLIGVPAAGSQDGAINLAIPVTVIRKFFEDKGFEYLMSEETTN